VQVDEEAVLVRALRGGVQRVLAERGDLPPALGAEALRADRLRHVDPRAVELIAGHELAGVIFDEREKRLVGDPPLPRAEGRRDAQGRALVRGTRSALPQGPLPLKLSVGAASMTDPDLVAKKLAFIETCVHEHFCQVDFAPRLIR
jgi:hypothetical protein